MAQAATHQNELSPVDAQRLATLEALRPEILAEVKKLHQERGAFIRRQFEVNHDAEKLLRETTKLADNILKTLYEASVSAMDVEINIPLALVAVGGYGRDELFPHSDLDLLFLHDGSSMAVTEMLVQFVLYTLWDMGLKVGHARRSITETLELAEKDIGTHTALLDARLVCGNRKLFEQFQTRFREELIEPTQIEFVEAKLEERDVRHQRWGDSRFVLEPQLKEGKGGLRDLHTLYWIAKHIYGIRQLQDLVGLKVFTQEEYNAFRRARELMWRIRAVMHFTAGRTEDRLTFDMQRSVAEALGFNGKTEVQSVERLMKRYFMATQTVGSLTRIFCALLEAGKKRKPRIPLAKLLHNRWKLEGFALDGERLSVPDDRVFEKDPTLMLKLFAVAQEQELDIHPHALRLVTQNLKLVTREMHKDKRANDLFLRILLSPKAPDAALRRMSETGLLGKFIPDFGRVQGQMQFNMYHIYTVDEHTLFAIGILRAIESGKLKADIPLASEIAPRIQQRRALFLAMFCHDIAKGRGVDHSEAGEKVALKLASRFGFSQSEKEATAWLVRYHLLMSNTAFKRDINDPKTVQDFVGLVQSVERLRMLLVLTAADIRAVGPHVWNNWKAALLRDLYRRAEALMTTGSADPDSTSQDALGEEIKTFLPKWKKAEIQEMLALGTPALWNSFGAATHARILETLARVLPPKSEEVATDVQHDANHTTSEVIVCTSDRHGLFSQIAGSFAMAGANIVGAKIFTLKNGIAVDVFQLQDIEKQSFDHQEKLARFEATLANALKGKINLWTELSAKQKSYQGRKDTFRVPACVFIDNNASNSYTVIEVVGHDSVGFLYRVTRALAEQGVSVVTSHINTYGTQVADVFYVKDVFGMKIHHPGKLEQMRNALLEAASY